MKNIVSSLFILVILSCSHTSSLYSFDIKGEWVVKRYKLYGISAFDENEANSWLKKRLVISKNKMELLNTKGDFKCSYTKKTEKIVPIKKHPIFKTPHKQTPRPKNLGITDKKLLLINTDCDDNRLEEITLLKNNKVMLMLWEGVYFFLEKEKK